MNPPRYTTPPVVDHSATRLLSIFVVVCCLFFGLARCHVAHAAPPSITANTESVTVTTAGVIAFPAGRQLVQTFTAATKAATVPVATGQVGWETDTGSVYRATGTSAGNWTSAGGSGSSTLAAMTDVDFTSLASGDFLKYNGTDWINRTAANARTDLGLGAAATKAVSGGGAGTADLGKVPEYTTYSGIDGMLGATGGFWMHAQDDGTVDAWWTVNATGGTLELFANPTESWSLSAAAGTLTDNRSVTIPDASGVLVIDTATQTLTNKTINGGNNTISNLAASVIASGTFANELLSADVTLLGQDIDLASEVTGTLPVANGGANVNVSGTLLTNASTTTRAGFRLPHGSAPTSPVDGDVWTTSAGGMYARINGATVGPFGAGGSGTVSSVSVTTANGISGTVATATTTPAITLSLGAITPTLVTVGAGTNSATPADGLGLNNSTAAISGTQSASPATVWTGQGWKTTATAASQAVAFKAYVLPVQGTTAPTGKLVFTAGINGGAHSEVLNLNSAGVLSGNSWSIDASGNISGSANSYLRGGGRGFVSGVSTYATSLSDSGPINNSAIQFLWTDGTSYAGTIDTGLARGSAAVVKVTNGSSTYGTIDGKHIIQTAAAPSSASDTGTAGEVRWDASFIYLCTATNTWKRVAIATW